MTIHIPDAGQSQAVAQSLISKEQLTVEYLGDASDCLRDAISTLTKLARLGHQDDRIPLLIRNLGAEAQALEDMRQQCRVTQDHSGFFPAALTSLVYPCQSAQTN